MVEVTQPAAFGNPEKVVGQASVAQQARFAAIVERQSRFIFRLAYALLRNTYDAEDVVQETYLKIYRAGAWEAIENERAFLARVAWRIAVGKLRKKRQVPLDPETAIHGVSPEDAAIATDWNMAVQRLVDALPQKWRQPLALSTVEEMSSREIAEVMRIPEGTVRTRIMRARQILKQKISELMEGRYGK